jgi:class 3 adenylate cyclase
MSNDSRPVQRLCLLLADLSGYTAYFAASEPERAPAMVADLVETVVRQLRPTFRLEKLEGDAAFMVAPLENLTGAGLIDALDATTIAFQGRLRSMAQATTCTCEACRRIPELDLKFVVHAGTVVSQRVAGRTELAGTDAIIAHRLLKAKTPSRLGAVRYALLTDAAVRILGLDPAALGLQPGVERFDYLGEVDVHLLDLAARGALEQPTWTPPRRRPLLEAELQIPLAPMALWERLTAPTERARWEGLQNIEEVGGTAWRGVGTVTACIADRLTTVEEILEWRPFEVFVRTVKLADKRRLTARHRLEPDGEGTRLRISWWGGAPASAHAQREHERLLRLAM